MSIKNIDSKDSKEKILCSAIWYKELGVIDKNKECKKQMLPINCNSGVVFCGHRHLQCMRTMNAVYGLSDYEAGKSTQGFLTNFNRFVDREEGGKIAFNAGQTERLKTYLFSEDLW